MTTPQLVTMLLYVLVEGALAALLLVQWRSGRFGKLSVRATRALLVGSVVVSAVAILEVRWEIAAFDLPWTQPGHALGTYAQPSALGVLLVGVTAALFVVAAILALSRPRWAAGIYLGIAAWAALNGARTWLTDPTAPRASVAMGLVAIAGPALLLAGLVWLNRGRILESRD
ncbi:MAG: hypothetical protein IT299_10690 [Dehalococcoidia bacterium]|nr:hypothetical protein [Dehalococcoidia bacterium]